MKTLVDELTTAAVLVKRGYLDANKADDKRAINAAFQRMITELMAVEYEAIAAERDA